MDPNFCTWPEIKQRAHYLCWLGAALGSAVLLGLTFDLLVGAVTSGHVGPELVGMVYLSAVIPPYVYVWRKHGEAHCGFLELEHAMDAAFAAADRTDGFARILQLIERIDAAHGMERQLVRNEAKAWLLAHAGQLSDEEHDYVAEHLGYLHRR